MMRDDGFTRLIKRSSHHKGNDAATRMEVLRSTKNWVNTFGASDDTNVDPHFNAGLGVTIRKGRPIEVYRLSDPHSNEALPSIFKNVDGVNLELAPGRGFRISLHRTGG